MSGRPPITWKRLDQMLDHARKKGFRVCWYPESGQWAFEPIPERSAAGDNPGAATDNNPQADEKSVEADEEIVL